MAFNLKDIGQKLGTNPFFNPLGSLVNQNKTQKELAALKAAQANQPLPDFSSSAPASNTAPSAPTSAVLPTWAIVTISLVGVGAVIGIVVLIAKNS